MFLKQKIRLLLCRIFLQVSAPFAGVFHSFPKESRKRIVLLRNDALGDFIVFLYSAFALRSVLPAKEYCLAVFVTKANEEWAKKSGLFDEVYVTERTNTEIPLGKRLKQLLLFHLLPADVFINTLHCRNGDPDLLAFASPAKRKYGFSLTEWPSPSAAVIHFYESVYTAVYPLSKETSLIDSTCSLLELAAERPVIPQSLRSTEFSFLKGKYSHGLTEQPCCVIVPGSSLTGKNWQVENFVETIRRIRQEFPCLNIVLTGSKEETGLCSEIGEKVPVCSLCGKLTLSDLASVLGNNAALCIANDTGTAHLASVFGVPTVCILSGLHYGLYVPCPYRKNLIAVYHKKDCFSCNGICRDHVPGFPYPCIKEITVDEVMTQVQKIMQISRSDLQPMPSAQEQ